MPYIGNNLATQFQAFATQTITGDGSTSYTLDRAVANGKELLVYINNVKQEEGSGKSYEASGTTITFSEAVASGDSCYLVYMGSAQQTVTAPAGSIVSSQFSSADLVLPKTVTIGSAAEEDTKLVFDGNAQDFHIGLDDSADDLVIGKGSALGTTTHMAFTEDGEVRVELTKNNQTVLVSIIDTGIGIPKGKINSLFKVFTQADDSTTRKYGGTGLGLSICKQLASLLNGQISFESTEGKGSTFTFTIQLDSQNVEKRQLYKLKYIPRL